MIRIPFIGGTDFPENIGLGAERTVNLYPEKLGETTFLRNTPGSELWTTAGNGPIRNAEEWDGHLYVLSGNTVYQINDRGGTKVVGSVKGSAGRVSMTDCGAGGLLILDSGEGWYYNGTFQKITDPDFPFPVVASTFLDGFAIVVRGDSGEFYISRNTYDLAEWNALDFATAEASPDKLRNVYADKNLLFLLGDRSTEIYTNTGNPDFPFEAIRQAMSHFGIAAKDTLTFCDGNLYWVGQNATGGRTVLRLATAADPQKVSTFRLDDYLSDLSVDEIETAFGLGIWWRGHPWYVLSIPLAEGAGRTFVYDGATGQWFEWSTYANTWNAQGRWNGTDHYYFRGRHIVTDGQSGDLYELKENVFTDFGKDIVRERTMEIFNTQMEQISFHRLSLMMDTGTGTPGTSYTSELSMSKDGGYSFGNSRTKSIGDGGERGKHVSWSRLGHAKPGQHTTFRWITSAKCPITIRSGVVEAS